MPIRKVKQYSDRESIKNLSERIASEEPLSASEVRMQKLFDFAQKTHDSSMQAALGLITTDYIADKNAIPLSAYRIRQMVADIKSKSSSGIDELSQELSGFFGIEETPESKAYWDNKKQVKTASKRKPPFCRANK
jgi:hypothetical protein